MSDTGSLSARDPAPCWTNNVAATLVLLDAMRRHGPRLLVFSSSAAVYGDPGGVAVTEEHPRAPVNPYGRTKLAIENALGDYSAAYGLRSIALRSSAVRRASRPRRRKSFPI